MSLAVTGTAFSSGKAYAVSLSLGKGSDIEVIQPERLLSISRLFFLLFVFVDAIT